MTFASTASCSGSRSTIYTGLHTHENGQYGLNWYKSHLQTFQHIDSAPELFNPAGYLTGVVGKVHIGPDELYSWQVREEGRTRDVAWVADRCEAFFEKAKKDDKPFFLTVGYIDPHRDVSTRGKFGNHEEQYGTQVPLNYWPTRILRTRTHKYHGNVAWRLDFPFAAELYASVAFEGIRNMSPPVMIGQRTFKDYIFRRPEALYDLEADQGASYRTILGLIACKTRAIIITRSASN